MKLPTRVNEVRRKVIKMPRARKSKFMEVSVDRFNEKVEAFNDYLQEEPRKSPEITTRNPQKSAK